MSSESAPHDIADEIALDIYGKSGRANAPENQNAQFQDGFKVGAALENREAFDAIHDEWLCRGSLGGSSEDFHEWKRGLWAAVLQKSVAKALTGAKTGTA
jgi:hypothetical protein